MNLYVKNMVCPRCIMSVEQILKKNGICFFNIRLGEVQLPDEPTEEQLTNVRNDLQQVGFELLDNQRKQQIEQIKSLLIQLIQQADMEEHFSLSRFISAKLHKDYSHLSKLFTGVEGITIEQFFILQKTEKVKEWLVYNEFSLNEIALNLGYSSVQHLSTQFKKLTGMTPSQFKKIGISLRKPLDGLNDRPGS